MTNFSITLIQQVQNGNQNACNQLYKQLLPYVKGILYNTSKCRNGIWLDDLSHDITSHILCGHVINNFNCVYNFKAWVATVTKNKFVDYLKKQNKYANEFVESRLSANDGDDVASYMVNHSDFTLADDNFLRNEKSNYLNRIIEKHLNEDMKTIIKLWYYDGYNQEEIAKITGWSISQIGVLHHRAKQKLKQFLNY